MIYKRVKLVAMLIVMCMLITLLPAGKTEKYEASEKVGAELLELLDITYEDLASGNFEDNGETYPCIIWIQEVEIEEAVKAGIDAAEKTKEGYSVWSRYDYPYTAYERDGLTYVEVELDESENDEYVQTYIEAEREAAAELYSANNSSFVAENFMARDMSVTYVSRYSPCIFAELNVTKLVELAENDNVLRIGYTGDDLTEGECTDLAYYGDATLSTNNIQNAMEVVRVDEAQDVYNVTGDGVKIGQIETYVPSVSTVTINPNGFCVEDNSATHPDNVYSIMAMTAPDATYYATGDFVNDGDFYEQIEWLLDQGVNIINQSAGAGNENTYSDRARWVDHIAYNHDVHFVQAAGNSMLPNDDEVDGVASVGMAYNIITVGSVWCDADKNYQLDDRSSYNHNGATMTTYKPDIVAPGSYTADLYGTSLAAPMVTGIVALMCDYRPALKTKQFAVKAILAATTNGNTHKYVTTDLLFKKYGAGMVDARSALYAIYVGDYSTTTSLLTHVGTSKTYTMDVTSSDTLMRVALAYGSRIEYETDDGEHSITDVPSGYIGQLDLEVYDPNGNLVEYVHSEDLERWANLKVLEFEPDGVYGNYTIKVTVVTRAVYVDNTAISFDIAWR